jgi:hypothetical protein
MIVRINQFDVIQAERVAGWGGRGPWGAVEYHWPDDALAFEVLILDRDEKAKPLPKSFRQTQLRQLVPEVLAALIDPGEEVVVRLDGALSAGELLGVTRYLTDSEGRGRFAISAAQKFDDGPSDPAGSVRLKPPAGLIAPLCADTQIGLERDVRLRAFSVPEPLVNPLLDTADLDDERWDEILPQAGFALSTVKEMKSLVVVTRRFTAADARERLMTRLVGGGK